MKKYLSPMMLMAFVLAMSWTNAPLIAQTFPNAWRTYDQFDGLVGSWVFDTAQTGDAALWFGTDEGIMRFDGFWTAFGTEDGLPGGAVRALLVTDDDELWIGTQTGVFKWFDDGWVRVGVESGLSQSQIYSLVQRQDSSILAGTNNGLVMWDSGEDTWVLLKDAPEGPAKTMVVDAEDTIWLAGDKELYRHDGVVWEKIPLLIKKDTLASDITVLEPGRLGGVWIGTDGDGLGYYNEDMLEWYNQESGLPGNMILSLEEDDDGALWVGTNGNGAGRLLQREWTQYTVADGIAADFVTSVFLDRDGILWFGTVAGISRFDIQTWKKWTGQDNVPTSLVASLGTTPTGQLLAGTYGDGLYQFDGSQWRQFSTLVDQQQSAVEFVESIFVDEEELWIGSNGSGVFHLKGDEIIQWTTEDGLAGDVIMDIAKTADGAMWFATYEHGLSRWDGSDWLTFTSSGVLTDDHIKTLLVDGKDRLWVGTQKGVSMFDGDAWQHFDTMQGLAASEVTDIAEAADGSVWFSTWGGGVSRYDEGEWTTFSTSDGLLAPGVEAVYADKQHPSVWFGTVSGLSTYDGRTWQNFRAADGNEIGRIYAIAPGPQGGLYLGTSSGVAQFQPDKTEPSVQILTVNGVAPVDGKVRLTPQEQVRITVSGSDLLTTPTNLFYVHRLQDNGAGWSGSRNTTVTYPALAEGLYRFEVVARDESMNYSLPAEVEIEVLTAPSMVNLPWIGPIRGEYALLGVAITTLIAMLILYGVWSTVTRIAMRKQAVERRFNPYLAGPPIREAEMFYGREALLNEIETALYQNSIMIHGERRIGKTSLLYQLKFRLEAKQDPAYYFIPIYVDLEGTPVDEFFHRLMEGVLEEVEDTIARMPGQEQLHYYTTEPDEIYNDRDFRRDLKDIIEYLSNLGLRQPRLIFLLDEADILNTFDTLTQQQLRRILQDAFARSVGAVVAGVNISKAWDRVESPWYNMFVEMELPAFDRHEAERLMREPVARFYDWDDDAIHYVWAQSHGRPHLIQQICLESVNLMLDEKSRTITLKNVEQAYDQIIEAGTD